MPLENINNDMMSEKDKDIIQPTIIKKSYLIIVVK